MKTFSLVGAVVLLSAGLFNVFHDHNYMQALANIMIGGVMLDRYFELKKMVAEDK